MHDLLEEDWFWMRLHIPTESLELTGIKSEQVRLAAEQFVCNEVNIA